MRCSSLGSHDADPGKGPLASILRCEKAGALACAGEVVTERQTLSSTRVITPMWYGLSCGRRFYLALLCYFLE